VVPVASPGVVAQLPNITPFDAGGVRTVTVPASISSDCSVDVTAPLLAWIAAAPNGSTFEFGQGACYRIDGSLHLRNRSGLVFDGNGATFKAVTSGDQDRRLWWFEDSSGIVVRDMVVRGANPYAGLADAAYRDDRAFQHAFAFHGVVGAIVDHVEAYDVYGDFVYIGKSAARVSSNVVVQGSHFERNGRQGISVTAATDVVLRDNYLGELRRATFDFEPTSSTWTVQRVLITGNTTGRGRLLWFASAGQGYHVNDITITGNTMTSTSGVPVIKVDTPDSAGGFRGPFTITGNTFRVAGSPVAGFDCHRCRGFTFTDNIASFPANRYMTAVSATTSSSVRVLRNVLPGAATVLRTDAATTDILAQVL
jgi:hypothetical protein